MLPIRFSEEADNLLRPPNSRRGDIARRIIEAVEGSNLENVWVEERSKLSAKVDYRVTSLKMEKSLHAKLTKAAELRGVSVSVLIDGCVRSYWRREDSGA